MDGGNTGIIRDLLENDVSGQISSDHPGIQGESPGTSRQTESDEGDFDKEEEDF